MNKSNKPDAKASLLTNQDIKRKIEDIVHRHGSVAESVSDFKMAVAGDIKLLDLGLEDLSVEHFTHTTLKYHNITVWLVKDGEAIDLRYTLNKVLNPLCSGEGGMDDLPELEPVETRWLLSPSWPIVSKGLTKTGRHYKEKLSSFEGRGLGKYEATVFLGAGTRNVKHNGRVRLSNYINTGLLMWKDGLDISYRDRSTMDLVVLTEAGEVLLRIHKLLVGEFGKVSGSMGLNQFEQLMSILTILRVQEATSVQMGRFIHGYSRWLAKDPFNALKEHHLIEPSNKTYRKQTIVWKITDKGLSFLNQLELILGVSEDA